MVSRNEFVVTFVAKDGGLVARLDQAGKAGETAGKRIDTGLKRARASSASLNIALNGLRSKLIGLGIGLTAVFSARQGIQDALKFGKVIGEVGTIAGVSAVELQKLRQGTLDLATGLGLNESIVARGLYQTLSAGITDAAEASTVLAAAADLAVAGVATTDETVNILTSTLNAYKREAGDAAEVSDVLFQTVRLGKTTISELATSFGIVAPIAAATGVSLEELSAAIATITLSGLSTAEAATQVRSALTNLGKRAETIRGAFRLVGKEFSLSRIRTEGLIPVLQDLRDITGGNNEELFQLLGRIEAVNAVLNLTGPNLSTFNRILGGTSDAASSVKDALDIQFDQPAVRLEAQLNAIRQGVEELANAFIVGIVGGNSATNVKEFREQLVLLRKEVESAAPGIEGLAKVLLGLASGFQLAADLISSIPVAIAGQIQGLDESVINDALAELENKVRANFGLKLVPSFSTSSTEEAAKTLAAEIDAAVNRELGGVRIGGNEADDFFRAQFEAASSSAREFGSTLRSSVDISPELEISSSRIGFLFDAATESAKESARVAREAFLAIGTSGVLSIAFNPLQDLDTSGLRQDFEDLRRDLLDQEKTFQTERQALIAQITSDLSLQEEAISNVSSAEVVRIGLLVETNELSRTQADILSGLVNRIRDEAIEKLRSAEATRKQREASQGLQIQLNALRADISGRNIESTVLTQLLQELRDLQRDGNIEGFNATLRETQALVRELDSAGAQFVAGFTEGFETLTDTARTLGSEVGNLVGDAATALGRGEQAWESYKEAALRAIAEIAARALASGILNLIFGNGLSIGSSGATVGNSTTPGGNFVEIASKGGISSFAAGGFKAMSSGAFPIGGVARNPTIAMFGDQSNKFKGEAFVPIPADAKGIPVEFRGLPQQPSFNDSGSNGVNVVIQVQAIDTKSFQDRLAQSAVRAQIRDTIADAMSRETGFRESVRSVSRGA